MRPDEAGGAGEAAPAPIDPRLVEYARTHDRALRNALVEDNMGLALHFTTRYRRSDTEDDDLRQVALLGLVKAIDRFDPTRGVAFSTFAGRTIDGELKRHFRDQTWALRVPRSVKDLHVSVRRASEALEQQLSRSPTVRELADHLDVSVDEVIGALGATAAPARGQPGRPRPPGRDHDPSGGFLPRRGPAGGPRRGRSPAVDARAPRTGDHPAPLLRAPEPGADRGAGRVVADARVAPAASELRADAAFRHTPLLTRSVRCFTTWTL
jgi:RNA polymerase sigma factor (sigma-70 family)